MLDKLVFGELDYGINVVIVAAVGDIVWMKVITEPLPPLCGIPRYNVDSHLYTAVAPNNSLSNPRAYVGARVRISSYRLSAERTGFQLEPIRHPSSIF